MNTWKNENGNTAPSKAGTCGFKPVWPTLPKSFLALNRWTGRLEIPWPKSEPVSPHNSNQCATFTARHVSRPNAKPQPETLPLT